jgi:hypothetical protein
MPWLVGLQAADAPQGRPAPPDVVVDVAPGWVAFVDGDACDGVYVVVPTRGTDIAGATFWSIPFHPDGVVAEEKLAEVCDYGAILDGAVATKQALETRFGRTLAAQPVAGFLYSASEGYALGTMLVEAGRQLSVKVDPSEAEVHASQALLAIGRHQRVLLGNAVKARPDRDEVAFVKHVDFSYTLRRFEIEDQGPLTESDVPAFVVVSPATEASVRSTLESDARVRKCIAKISERAGVEALGLEVEITAEGDVARIGATADGASCFDKPIKKGILIEGWKDGAITVKILVPASQDTVPP